MDFLEPPYGRNAMASDLQDASMSQNFIKALETVGFTKTQIAAIAYQNVIDFFENL
jgi:microsomal dipeptidase-like Zn-dependent dipeptidase